MKNLGITIALLALATPVFAEDVSPRVPTVEDALEVTAAVSSTYGRGGLGGAMDELHDVAGPGLGFDFTLGYRATPNLLIGGYASLAGHGRPDDSDNGAVTASIGLLADWHFRPATKLDPWVSVGTGWKVIGIEAPGESERALTGLELVKVRAGLDYRMSPRFAIGPVIGASATMYRTSYDDAMSDHALAIEDTDINWTFSVGVLGRFDAFATVGK